MARMNRFGSVTPQTRFGVRGAFDPSGARVGYAAPAGLDLASSNLAPFGVPFQQEDAIPEQIPQFPIKQATGENASVPDFPIAGTSDGPSVPGSVVGRGVGKALEALQRTTEILSGSSVAPSRGAPAFAGDRFGASPMAPAGQGGTTTSEQIRQQWGWGPDPMGGQGQGRRRAMPQRNTREARESRAEREPERRA